MNALDKSIAAMTLICFALFGLVMSRAVSPDPFLAPLTMGSFR
jgi:hypothetical protein